MAMEYTARLQSPSALARRLSSRIELPALSAWTLAFSLVTYLAMRNGGYDTIVRSEVGVAVWWIVLLAALAGFLPARIGRAGWAAIALLGSFAIWTGLAAGWSVSPGDTITELGREAAYLGFLVLAIALQGRAAARHTVNGLASAFALVTVLAVLSRLHPQWFPDNPQFQVFGAAAARRLSYPLNYWNALAAFSAMGVPLLVAVALSARHAAVRALATAVLPLSILCIYLTISRGGVLELGVAVVVLIVLVPRRLRATATLLLGGAGGAILVLAASNRPAARTGLQTPAALHQGSAILTLAVIVCAGVALLQAALALADNHFDLPAWARSSRRATTRRALALLLVGVVAALAVGAPSRLAHAWDQFTAPTGTAVAASQATVFSRLSAINGNGRYQYWMAALHANATRPLTGTGPGTFQYWWAARASNYDTIVNAHSLYFETLADTGVIGLVLIGGLLLLFVGTAVRRSLDLTTSTSMRITIAAATASLMTFMTAAALEWVWQMAALAAAAIVLGAVIVAGRDHVPARSLAYPRRTRATLLGIPVLAVLGLLVVALPLAEAVALTDSHNAYNAGHLAAAYDESLTAQRIEPYAAAPRLQEALVLEAARDYGPAVAAARIATQDAPTDWAVWLTLARIDVRRNAYAQALAAFDRARALDPRNALWQEHT
jgi:hypothetical protein